MEGVRYKRIKMVKNRFGGSKSKGLARKNEKEDYNRKLRVPQCEEEKYAIVKKIYGGDMCEVLCEDNVVRIAIIRGKFSGGKGKRHNIITVSTLLLVGLRSWATVKHDSLEKTDVLEVYSSIEYDLLSSISSFPSLLITFKLSLNAPIIGDNHNNTDSFIFTSITTSTYHHHNTDTDTDTIHNHTIHNHTIHNQNAIQNVPDTINVDDI